MAKVVAAVIIAKVIKIIMIISIAEGRLFSYRPPT